MFSQFGILPIRSLQVLMQRKWHSKTTLRSQPKSIIVVRLFSAHPLLSNESVRGLVMMCQSLLLMMSRMQRIRHPEMPRAITSVVAELILRGSTRPIKEVSHR